MLYAFKLVALLPVLLIQAAYVGVRAQRLPEAEGVRYGTAGQGRPLRLLILGDSAAAGVGVQGQDQALSGQLVQRLQSDFEVDWQLIAKTGATTRSTLATLSETEAASFDVAVISLGVNDATRLRPVNRWRKEQAALRTLLRQKFQVRHILLSGMPPLGDFPLLPQPLRRTIGLHSAALDKASQRAIAEEADAFHLPFDVALDPDMMAVDGFHPGAGIYALWADRVAERIRDIRP